MSTSETVTPTPEPSTAPMASEQSTTPVERPSTPTTADISQEKPQVQVPQCVSGIPRNFYITLRNIGLIFLIAFPMAHMASWAFTIWMLGRGADKLAATLDTAKPFDEIAFRNTLRHVVVAGARGWKINVIMLSIETFCSIIGGIFLIRGLSRANRLLIKLERGRDLEAQMQGAGDADTEGD
ncbi:hypothetical protein TWF718_005241 [Orbilia javanica]|uniref:Uncharacterized protein n=1 Tax=Orbilia javanica TaxID=47235 RepID=A0AAN8MUN5_9PEZI